MSLEKIIEERIQEAMANGEFDNLEGAGKPLNLDEYNDFGKERKEVVRSL